VNFESMNIQKKLVMFATAAGILAMFLPWVHISAFGMDVGQNYNGLRGSGIFIFVCFMGCIYFCLTGDYKGPFSLSEWFYLQILSVLIIFFTLLEYYFKGSLNKQNPFGLTETRSGEGFWIALLSGIGIMLFLWLYKPREYTIKAGFKFAKRKLGLIFEGEKKD